MKILTLADLQRAKDLFFAKSFDDRSKLIRPIQKRGMAVDMFIRAGGTMTWWPVDEDEDGNEVFRDEYTAKGCESIYQKYLYIYPYTLENRLFWEKANERDIWNHVIPTHSPWLPDAFSYLRKYFRKKKRGLIYMAGKNIGKVNRVVITIDPFFVPDPKNGLTVLEIVSGNRSKRSSEEVKAHLSTAPFLRTTIPNATNHLVKRIGSIRQECEEEWGSV